MDKIDLKDIENAFFNYDSSCSESRPGEWEKRRDEWQRFKKYLLITIDRQPELGEDCSEEVKEAAREITLSLSEEPKEDTGGWIKWEGGDRPVDWQCMVSIRRRDGMELEARIAKQWTWRHADRKTDLVAYKVISTPEKSKDRWVHRDWIENKGFNECPVPAGQLFSVKYRCGVIRHNILRGSGYARDWDTTDVTYDILEYRIGETEGFGKEVVEG